MATVNKTANESNESKLINDNESNDLNDHQHSETSEDQLIKNEMEGMEEEESDEESEDEMDGEESWRSSASRRTIQQMSQPGGTSHSAHGTRMVGIVEDEC